jgi:hypothetical protein
MTSRGLAVLTLGIAALAGLGHAREDANSKTNCFLNAFASRLGLTPAQKEQAAKIHSEFEQKAAPVCEKIWMIYCDHRQAVLQILSAEQRRELPQVVKSEQAKMLQTLSTKLGLNDQQMKEAEKICHENTEKIQELADHRDAKSSEKFLELKRANLEAFCKILTDDQRIKLPALVQEELVSGRTPSVKSEIHNMMVEKLKLNTDQTQRLDKVCEDFSAKMDREKEQLHQLWKEKIAAVEKILTPDQRKKFQDLVKASD